VNFKKLSFFIIILGLAALAYGIIEYQNNQPVQFNTANSRPSVFGGRDDMGNYLRTKSENYTRAARRKGTKKYIIAGGIVLFLGVGVLLSVKK